MDPSAIKPPGRIAVSRFNPRQRAGGIVAPIDGAITSRAPAPQLVHEDPQRTRRHAADNVPEEIEPATAAPHPTAHAILGTRPASVVSGELLLMTAQMEAYTSSSPAEAYRPAASEDDSPPHTDIEV